MAWTYTTLIQAIKDYTENTETTFVSNIPVFVKTTEEQLLRSIQLPDFRKNVTGTLTQSNQYLATPSDFLYPYSLSINNSGYEFLIFKDVNFIREAFPDSTATGVPKYYSIFDDETFLVAPTPNGNFTAELHYSFLPQSIVDAATGTSWLGDNATNALLYGSLVQAYIFMKGEPDIIQQYQQQFEIAVGQLKKEGEGFNRTDAYRTGQASISTK
tara:strand:+ start:443 stop:1084 length:642 start_codon:yes stop_codon:yes gene_type:complete